MESQMQIETSAAARSEARARRRMSRRFPQTRAIEIAPFVNFTTAEVERLTWQISQAGFNTVLFRCFSGGHTTFCSSTMDAYGFPCQNPQFSGTDPAVEMLEAARREGLTVYALLEGMSATTGAGGQSPILHRRPEWAVRRRGGAWYPDDRPLLCPVNPDVRRFFGDLCYEIMQGYAFAGLYLRHIHFPLATSDKPSDVCYCASCRREVWRALGVRIDAIPDDPDHPDRHNITAWCTRQLATLLNYLRLRTAKACIRPLTTVELYMSPNEDTPNAHLGYQDRRTWTEEGLVPIAAMRPFPEPEGCTPEWLERLAAAAQESLVMPVLETALDDRLIETLHRLATEPIAGIVVPEPHDLTAPPINQLVRGPWQEPAQPALVRPLESVCGLLTSTIEMLAPNDPVGAFLADVLRVVEPPAELCPPHQRETLYANLLGLEERIAGDKIDLGDAAPIVLRNFRLARHLLRLMEYE
jgi:hypothetical protein